jgi:hypothetical protein
VRKVSASRSAARLSQEAQMELRMRNFLLLFDLIWRGDCFTLKSNDERIPGHLVAITVDEHGTPVYYNVMKAGRIEHSYDAIDISRRSLWMPRGCIFGRGILDIFHSRSEVRA